MEEAIKMWSIVNGRGVHAELMVCEKEGHGALIPNLLDRMDRSCGLIRLGRFQAEERYRVHERC